MTLHNILNTPSKFNFCVLKNSQKTFLIRYVKVKINAVIQKSKIFKSNKLYKDIIKNICFIMISN